MTRNRRAVNLSKLLAVLVVFAFLVSLPLSSFAAMKENPSESNDLTKAAPAKPSESEIQVNLINGYISKGEEDKALQALEKVAVSIDKFSNLTDWVNVELWRIAKAKNKMPDVIADLEKASAKDTKNVGLKRIIARGYEQAGDTSKTAAMYEQMAADNPTDPTIATRLVDSYMLAKDYDKVIEKLEPIVNANPNDSYHSDLLAHAYVAANMTGKALALYKKKIDREPTSPGLRGRYAQAFTNFGMLEEAAKEWKKAAELDPSNPYFKQQEANVLAQIKAQKTGR